MMELIELFHQQNWKITFASPAQLSDHMDDLSPYNVTTAAITLNCASFDQYVSQLQPDIVLFDRFMMEEQFGWRVEKHCPKALRILESSDLHCLRDARHQALKQDRAMMPADLCSDMAKREIASIYRCDLSLMISDYEIELLQKQFSVPAQLLHHLPFMLDTEELFNSVAFEERQHFISIGNFRHAPNWDAVRYLNSDVWPLIRQQLPNAELHIYGAYPPPKATQLHNPKKGFLVKGWAEDVHQVMQQARICLAPLRFGAGIKGKLADAMLNGTPSITTPIGAEAMKGELDWPGLIGETPQEIADAAVALYQDQQQWRRAQSSGYILLKQRYDRKPLGSALIQRIQKLDRNIDSERLANFTGQMLRHHQHRSTQFMSQWIEVKTQLAELNTP